MTYEDALDIRMRIVAICKSLIGVPYRLKAEWTDYNTIPKELDCSEMIEGVYRKVGLKMPDGSQNQFNFTIPTVGFNVGDLVFFGRNRDPKQIYHVGIVYDKFNIIEARDFDEKASFETGKVILRPIAKWEAYKNFLGVRAHPDLIEG